GASLGEPWGLAADKDGNVLIAEPPLKSLREVSTTAFNVVVAPAPLTIKADDKSMVAGGDLPPFTATFSRFGNGDNAANLAALPQFSTNFTQGSGPGIYVITVSSANSTNYTITYENGKLTVTDALHPLVGFAPNNRTVFHRSEKRVSIIVEL